MNTYQLSEKLSEIWCYGLLGAAAVYVATGRWRDYPDPAGRTAEQVATESRRRTRLVRWTLLGIVTVWFFADLAISFWAVRNG